MIIEARKEILSLAGALTENHWLTLKAAANLLLKRFPQGIIIEGSSIIHCTPEGVETFKDAFAYIHKQGSRIVFCQLPAEVQNIIQEIPEARSQFAITNSIEEARTSLGLDTLKFEKSSLDRYKILIPVFKGIDTKKSIQICSKMAREERAQVYLLYLLEIPLTKPMDTPLPHIENAAKEILEICQKRIQREGFKSSSEIKRVRNISDGIIQATNLLEADIMILSINKQQGLSWDPLSSPLFKLLQSSPCEVIMEWVNKSGRTTS